MPSWKIHSKIANDLHKQLKVNKKYFMIGNLLPDQDKYNIPNLDKKIDRKITHFMNKEFSIKKYLPDYNAMYQKYNTHFKNPILLGYLVHLLTDYYWNNYIYNKYFIRENNEYIGIKTNKNEIIYCDFSTANAMKHKDLDIYSNNLSVRKNYFRFCLNNNYFKEIDELKLSKKNIYEVGKYLNSSHSKIEDINKYQILNERELNKLLESSKIFILNYLKEKEIIKNNTKVRN